MRTCARLLILLLLVTTGLSAQAPPGEQEAVAKARKVLEALVARDFKGVTKSFDAKMSAALTPEKLQAGWDALIGQYGAFKKQGEARTEKSGGSTVVIIPTEFEKGLVQTRVAIDSAGKVSGLFLLPVPAAPAGPG